MAEDPTTWTELKTALATWMKRTDLTTVIPQAIAFAEGSFQESIFCPDRIASTTLAFAGESAALPTDFWGVETAYTGTSPKLLLQQVTEGELRRAYPYSATGTPEVFAIVGENMVLGPPPSTATVYLTYWQVISPLNGSTATNWLLTNHSRLYMAASLAWLHSYVRDYDEADRWSAVAAGLANSVNKAGRRRMTNSGPLAARATTTDQILSFIR